MPEERARIILPHGATELRPTGVIDPYTLPEPSDPIHTLEEGTYVMWVTPLEIPENIKTSQSGNFLSVWVPGVVGQLIDVDNYVQTPDAQNTFPVRQVETEVNVLINGDLVLSGGHTFETHNYKFTGYRIIDPDIYRHLTSSDLNYVIRSE